MKGADISVNNTQGERIRQLFINVVLRAVKDAFYAKGVEVAAIQKEQALNWLCNGSPDFFEVCLYAGLDGNAIRKKCQIISKMRKSAKGKYLKKILSSDISEQKKNEIMLETLAYKQEFLFLEAAPETVNNEKILKKAFDLCSKGDISIKINKNGNKLQYIAVGEKE